MEVVAIAEELLTSRASFSARHALTAIQVAVDSGRAAGISMRGARDGDAMPAGVGEVAMLRRDPQAQVALVQDGRGHYKLLVTRDLGVPGFPPVGRRRWRNGFL